METCGAAPGAHLPRILEIKRKLAGGEKRFDCAVLARSPRHLVVLFVAPAAMRVHGVALPAGTITFGHFWTDRPYNVYHWLDAASGDTIGYYVNLSDQTRFDSDTLEWRDLIVDLLARPDGPMQVLDEDELPAELPADLRARIAEAQAAVLGEQAALLAELERHRRALWPRVVPAPGDGGDGGGGPGAP